MTKLVLLIFFIFVFCAVSAYAVSSGSQLWVKRYNGTGNDYDDASSIAVDSSGNVYVTGISAGSSTSENYATIKYGPLGGRKWVKRYNGPGNGLDYATSIAVDSSGNVYVTGLSEGSSTSFDYATAKYDTAGNRKWVKRYNGPGNSYDWASSIAVDSSGNVYVTGNSDGFSTSFDYATVKYNKAGNRKWVKRYNGPENSDDDATSIAVDSSGNVYVAGTSYGSSTDYDYATVKYSP